MMVNLFRSFFMISLFATFIGIFMVALVHVMSEPTPGFAKLPAPTAYIIKTRNS